MRLAFIFFIIIASCKNPLHQVEQPIKKINIYPTDAMPQGWLNEKIEESKLFNLPLLFEKPEHFELRIKLWDVPWVRFGMGKDIFVFKLDSIGWSGYHYYSYTVPYKDQDGKLQSLDDPKLGKNTFLVKKFEPKCGWSNFSDSIGYFKIESLPTQDSTNGFDRKALLDGYCYEFEISRPNSYRFLKYNNPRSYEYDECKKIEAFMSMVKRQLGEDYYWPEKTP